jgi:CHAT domain-containing protein
LRYLAEDVEIVYLISARDLVRFAKKETVATSQEAFLVGDPAFNAGPAIRLQAIARGAQGKWPSPTNRMGTSEPEELPMIQSSTKQSPSKIKTDWEQLPRTRLLLKEAATQVGRAGMKPRILVDEFASEELIQYIHSPRLLIFATHGDFLEGSETPGPGFPIFITGDAPLYASGLAELTDPLMRSVLLLAGANNRDNVVTRYYVNGTILSEYQARKLGMSEEQLRAARFELGDGLLTAYEIWAMDLANTELVLVIGCETGLGAVAGTEDGNPPIFGEAVSGLRQAFAVAGVQSMIMSMWEVPEKQTIEQMGSFLEYWLSDKKPRFRAFYRAQLDALKRARAQFGSGHPFWWAGFVYIGDPQDTQ